MRTFGWAPSITDSMPFLSQILDDKTASSYIAGAGFQWEGKFLIGPAHQKYPELPVMQTESECGNAGNGWPDAAHTWELDSSIYLERGVPLHLLEHGAR